MPMRFFGKNAPLLSIPQQQRLQAWQALAPPSLGLAHYQTRYVVLSLKTDGLDPRTHAIRSLAAVGLTHGRIRPDDAFWIEPGQPDPEAWLAWLEFVGKAPLVGFQLPFLRPFLEQALEASLELEFRSAWLDLAVLLPEIHREAVPPDAALERWLEQAGLGPEGPRDPMQDALLLARLLQRLLNAARTRGIETPAELQEQLRARRWLHGES